MISEHMVKYNMYVASEVPLMDEYRRLDGKYETNLIHYQDEWRALVAEC